MNWASLWGLCVLLQNCEKFVVQDDFNISTNETGLFIFTKRFDLMHQLFWGRILQIHMDGTKKYWCDTPYMNIAVIFHTCGKISDSWDILIRQSPRYNSTEFYSYFWPQIKNSKGYVCKWPTSTLYNVNEKGKCLTSAKTQQKLLPYWHFNVNTEFKFKN